MTTLAIDPGKSLGWARLDRTTGVVSLGHEDEGEALARFEDWLAPALAGVDLLVIERPMFAGQRIRGADFTLALARVAHAVAWRHDVARRWWPAVQVRRAVFGPGKHGDRARVAGMRELGWHVADNHAADAAALLVGDAMLTAQTAADLGARLSGEGDRV